MNPRYAPRLRALGLTQPHHFLSLQAAIVGGHPDRHVARLMLGSSPDGFRVFLKRERCVRWSVRLESFLAGFGWVSRSVREGRILAAVDRAGVGCPEWLAVGEDEAGNAFLLLREVPHAVELRTYLGRLHDLPARRRFACRFGTALARIHGAGFSHPDLYTKHVLVSELDGRLYFLDWQRARSAFTVGWRTRASDLASLDATLRDEIVSPRERLMFLSAYLREQKGHFRNPFGVTLAGRHDPPSPAVFVRWIKARAWRLLDRRHVVEKRCTPAAGLEQEWICVDGQALCVTPRLRRLTADRPDDWLAMECQPQGDGPDPQRRWLSLPGAAPALLVRRAACRPLAALWARWRRRPLESPEHRQAALLLRLERHGIVAPRVLAMGQRAKGLCRLDSFLLSEPAADSVRLDSWLTRTQHSRRESSTVKRRLMLRRAGALLRRLHEAGCYLKADVAGCVFAVQQDDAGGLRLGLDNADGLRPARRARPDLAAHDLSHLKRALSDAGCDAKEVERFVQGYRPSAACQGPPTPPALPQEPQPLHDGMAGELPSPDSPAPILQGGFLRRLFIGGRRYVQQRDWRWFAGFNWLDRIMSRGVTDNFHAKQGRSTGRLVMYGLGAEPKPTKIVYLKRHYRLSWLSGWMALLWPGGDWSPAMQEWRHLEWARRQGVPVPRPVAAAEFIGPMGRLQSVLAVEELTGLLPLHEAIPLAHRLMPPDVFRRWKRSLIEELARLARLLHDRRCFHKDLYLCHFYIPAGDTQGLPATWRNRVHLIDLHRLSHHPWTWRIWQVKDLAQLLYSSDVEGVDARDRLWFWRAYLGPGTRNRDSWVRRWVVYKWRRYARHNERRKLRMAAEQAKAG
jgi:heptose I phosphotransferase